MNKEMQIQLMNATTFDMSTPFIMYFSTKVDKLNESSYYGKHFNIYG